MQNEAAEVQPETPKIGPVQDIIYEILKGDLAQMTELTNKAKGAKTRYAAKYYGKKAAKAKARVINTLKFAEKFKKNKKAQSGE
jgi:hypothetical protein